MPSVWGCRFSRAASGAERFAANSFPPRIPQKKMRSHMTLAVNDLNVPHRLLLGPGPSAVHPRVLRTMSTALIGYMDPEWLALMDEEQALLRAVFQTKNTMTFPMSGTGSAGMETAFCNFVEPGDIVVVGCNGYFSDRMCEMAKIYGARVKRIEKPWGSVFTPAEVEAALAENTPVKVFA